MNYISVREAAERWEMTPRRVQVLCNDGRIDGAQRVGNVWTIPENADKPIDARKKIIAPKAKINSNITIERIWAMPNKNTFEIKPIHDLIVDEITDGIWIDPFANRNKLASITNDLSTEFDTDYHLDALDFLKMFDTDSVDGVLYDPPYSPRQVSECYNNVGYNVTWDTTKASFWGNHKREISRIVKIGGKVITFGWNSGGIGYKYGFEIQKVLLVPHGGWHNDTICTVEIKTHEGEISPVKDSEKMGAHKSEKTTDTDKKLISLLQQLPENYWDFKEDDTREYTHGIHSYPAMMVCPISRNIIKIMKGIMPISSLFDPFSGSGTVLVEGLLSGIPNVVGNDINPLALFLAKVKTTQLDISTLQSYANNLLDSIRNRYEQYILQIDSVDDVLTNAYELDLTAKHGWGDNAPHYLTEYCEKNNVDINIPSFKNIGYWFKPRVILLLQIIKDEINKIEDKNMRNFAFVAFSESIRLVSNRRNGEFKMFRMPPVKVAKFVPDVINEFSTILQRNIEKMNAFVEACSDTGTNSKVTIFQNNANPLSHASSELLDSNNTSKDLCESIKALSALIYGYIDILNEKL